MDATEETLSNDEVDELMKGSTAGAEDSSHYSVELFDFGTMNNNISSFPGMKSINETFLIHFTNSYKNFINKKVAVQVNSSQTISYGQYLKQQQQACVYNCIQLPQQNSFALITISKQLIYYTMSLLFGGTLKADEEIGDIIAPASLQICKYIVTLIMQSQHIAWKDICELPFNTLYTTTNPYVINKISSEENLLITEYLCDIQQTNSSFSVCFFRSFLDKVKPALLASAQVSPDELEEKHWKDMLRAGVFSANMPLTAKYPTIKFRLNDLMALKPGDVIPISNPEIVEILCNKKK